MADATGLDEKVNFFRIFINMIKTRFLIIKKKIIRIHLIGELT